jgi:ABC-type glycerol-3-phosphate transport system substrate-binding protein
MLRKIYGFNKDKFKKFLISAATAMLLLFFLTSCELLNPVEENETGLIEEEAEESPEGESTDEEKQDVKITLWDYLEPKGRLALIESSGDFMNENTHIEIDIKHFRSQEELEDQFEAASLAGAGPELILLNFDGVERLVPGNVAKEITDEATSAADYSRFLDGLVEISRYGDRNYIIPFRSFDFLVLLYNKEFIEEPPESFEEIIEYCSEVNDFNQGIYGFLLNNNEADWVIPFIGGYGDWIIDYGSNSLTLSNQATIKTMEFFDYIYNQEKILPSNMEYSEINELFKSGNAHMIIDNINAVAEYRTAGIDIGVAKIPVALGSNRDPTPLISGTGFIINVNCYGNELQAVNEFIEYMMTEEMQAEWTLNTDTFPVLKDIDINSRAGADDTIPNAFLQAKLCRGRPYEKLIMVIRNAIRDNTRSVISGSLLPEDAALKIQEDALRLRSGDVVIEDTAEQGEKEGAGEAGSTEEGAGTEEAEGAEEEE